MVPNAILIVAMRSGKKKTTETDMEKTSKKRDERCWLDLDPDGMVELELIGNCLM